MLAEARKFHPAALHPMTSNLWMEIGPTSTVSLVAILLVRKLSGIGPLADTFEN
jgi:hypothetical protein